MTNLQSKKSNKKGTCSKVFGGTRLKWVLIHQGVYIAGSENFVQLIPSCVAFLDWLSS